MTLSLVARRRAGESWRAAVEREGREAGLLEEMLGMFDALVEGGMRDHEAAHDTMYAWDCLSLVNDETGRDVELELTVATFGGGGGEGEDEVPESGERLRGSE